LRSEQQQQQQQMRLAALVDNITQERERMHYLPAEARACLGSKFRVCGVYRVCLSGHRSGDLPQ
jgi:hypothetical protein